MSTRGRCASLYYSRGTAMLKKLLIVLAVLGVVVVFLLSRDWDSPELGQALLDKVSTATGIQIKAEGFRLNLLKGVVLEKVEAKASGEGRELTFNLDRLVFEHRLAPLLLPTPGRHRHPPGRAPG